MALAETPVKIAAARGIELIITAMINYTADIEVQRNLRLALSNLPVVTNTDNQVTIAAQHGTSITMIIKCTLRQQGNIELMWLCISSRYTLRYRGTHARLCATLSIMLTVIKQRLRQQLALKSHCQKKSPLDEHGTRFKRWLNSQRNARFSGAKR